MIFGRTIAPLSRVTLGAFEAGWFSTNPSVLRMEGGYLCLVKEVNWDFETVWKTGDYQALDPGDRIACRYTVAHLDENLQEMGRFELDAQAVLELARDGAMIEDLRLLLGDGAIFACGALVERPFGWTGERWIAGAPDTRIFVAELALDRLERPHVFASPTGARQEKNWAPVWREGTLSLVVDVASSGVVACDPARNYAGVSSASAAPTWSGGWSGSSPFIAWDDGHLGIVHRKTRRPPYRYAHLLLWLDHGLVARRRSEMFTFEGAPVEFCCGLDAGPGAVALSYGVMDRQAVVFECAHDAIDGLLVHGVSPGDLDALAPEPA